MHKTGLPVYSTHSLAGRLCLCLPSSWEQLLMSEHKESFDCPERKEAAGQLGPAPGQGRISKTRAKQGEGEGWQDFSRVFGSS